MQLQNGYEFFRFVTPAFLSSTGKPGYKLFSCHFFVTEISNVTKLLRYRILSLPVARLRNYKNLVPDYISTAWRRKFRACGGMKKCIIIILPEYIYQNGGRMPTFSRKWQTNSR
ncbi:hypothetical protein DW080_02910 [Bacteroides caccae]|nr:hypothetical protein DW080_02910 [Bacteroides caccae]